jgi:hypothetical protein
MHYEALLLIIVKGENLYNTFMSIYNILEMNNHLKMKISKQ